MVSVELEARLDNALVTAQEETADIDLFAPITEREECPLCLIPLSINEEETSFSPCCGKNICNGCGFKQTIIEIKKGVPAKQQKCAFCCQKPDPKNTIKALKKLMKKNHPAAIMAMGHKYILPGENGAAIQSYTRALEMYIRAAELGYAPAFYTIGKCYLNGIGVEQETSKALSYCEIAAKKGHLHAHKWLASFNGMNMDIQKCIKHYKVVAIAGDKGAMDQLMKLYKKEFLSKEELAQTLRAYQASSNEMKSKDRDDARVFFEKHPISGVHIPI